jgi:putative phage-type endonuclease
MNNVISHAEVQQGSPEWLEARNAGIGGSDAAAAIGVSKYKTPLELYNEKVSGKSDFKGNWFTERGKALEPVLRQWYASETGLPVKLSDHILKSEKYPFMLYSMDGFVETSNGNKLLEFKTASSYNGWGEVGSDEIPMEYAVQCQHGLIVLGWEECDVAVSIAGMPPQSYTVRKDIELQEMIIEKEHKFWQCVQNELPPEPANSNEMLEKFHIKEGAIAYANAEVIVTIEHLKNLQQAEKGLKIDIDECKEHIQAFLAQNEASILMSPDGLQKLVTWNEAKGRETFDAKAFSNIYPELHAQFTRMGNPSRRLLIK